MPNQRKNTKTRIDGWLEKSLRDRLITAAEKAGVTKTALIIEALVGELLRKGEISEAEARAYRCGCSSRSAKGVRQTGESGEPQKVSND
jgi:polyhydroxyalkanoate synthesis regulator phasin